MYGIFTCDNGRGGCKAMESPHCCPASVDESELTVAVAVSPPVDTTNTRRSTGSCVLSAVSLLLGADNDDILCEAEPGLTVTSAPWAAN